MNLSAVAAHPESVVSLYLAGHVVEINEDLLVQRFAKMRNQQIYVPSR